MPQITPNQNTKYQDLKGYPPDAQKTISAGIKSGGVRFEPSKTGGEYIATPKKATSYQKPKSVQSSTNSRMAQMQAIQRQSAIMDKQYGRQSNGIGVGP